MTSLLRMTSKDRSSFLFRRQNSDHASNSPSDRLAHHLPDISHLDTRSFAELFDQFMSLENDESPQPRQDISTITPSHLAGRIDTSIPGEPTRPLGNRSNRPDLDIARNDSTASSCYSQASQRESDYSPLVTRQSSSSSYTQEPDAASSRTTLPKIQLSITPPNPPSPMFSGVVKSGLISTQSTSTAKSSSILVVSSPPNLDKPLPPGPIDAKRASSSVPDLMLRHPATELPSELPAVSTMSVDQMERISTHQERFISARRASDSQAVPEIPIWSARSIQAARMGKAVANSHHRNRSVSETAVEQQGCAENKKSRRHTVDMQKLSSNVPSSRPMKTHRKQIYQPITAATAERVIYKIMCNLHSVQDLQSTAMVSKGFLRTFQRNESKLVSHLIFKTSRPAWELRRTILALKGSNDFVLRDYRRDCSTLVTLKAFIMGHCSSHCKQSTIAGLLGQDETRKAQIDDALWRIWTFCALFGNTVGQSGPSQTEIDWLNGSKASNNKQLGAGFAIGNGTGLATPELEDMIEMWQCLQVLVSGFLGRVQEAQKFGVFDNWHLRETTSESQHLAEWTSYLLALGPQTILSVSTCSFEQAKMLGLTRWTAPPAGQSRTLFLASAISQVYQERVLQQATRRAAQFSIPRDPLHRPTRSFDERQLATVPTTRTAIMQSQSLRIDTSGPKGRPVSTNALTDVRLEIRPDCDPANVRLGIRPDCDPATAPTPSSHLFPASPTADPTVFYSLGMTPTASTKLGATLFPMDYACHTPRVPFPAPERHAAPGPGIVDPVDKAMTFLVNELGFGETRVRKALAMCDTGSGLDLQKAIELLAVDSKESKQVLSSPVELPTPLSLASPTRLKKQAKAYCDGHCKRTPALGHARNESTGTTMTDVSVSPISTLDEAEWQDTVSPLVTSISTKTKTSLTRGLSNNRKAWKVLGMDTAPKRKNSVLHIHEYQAKVERRKSMRAVNSGGQSPKIKEGLSKNLLGLGLGIGIGAGAKSADEQLEQARDQERRKKEKKNSACLPRYA